MSYADWFRKSDLYPTERNAGQLAWNAAQAELREQHAAELAEKDEQRRSELQAKDNHIVFLSMDRDRKLEAKDRAAIELEEKLNIANQSIYHLNQKIASLTAQVEKLREACEAIQKLIESGRLVRNTGKDHELDWAIKNLCVVIGLQKLNQALLTTPVTSAPEPKAGAVMRQPTLHEPGQETLIELVELLEFQAAREPGFVALIRVRDVYNRLSKLVEEWKAQSVELREAGKDAEGWQEGCATGYGQAAIELEDILGKPSTPGK